MKYKKKQTIKTRILTVILGGGLIAITAFLGLWSFSEIEQENYLQIEDLISNTNLISLQLRSIVIEQFRYAEIISHSLSLRRYVIHIGQDNLKLPLSKIQHELQDLDTRWSDLDPSSDVVQEVTSSLEARFLKDIVSGSQDIIDSIEVSDAFGRIRVASRRPEKIRVADETWWRNALMLNPGEVWPGEVTHRDADPLWNLSVPLRNDEGKDAVGIIRIRLKLDTMFQRALETTRLDNASTHILTPNSLYPLPKLPYIIEPDYSLQIQTLRNGTLIHPDRKLIMGFSSVFNRVNPRLTNPDWIIVSLKTRGAGYSLSNPTLRNAFLLWLAGILILVLVGLILSRWITDPLLILTQGVKKISGGHLDVQIPAMGHGEIATLASSFNDMVKRLSSTSKRVNSLLKQLTKSLDAISEFTQEISQTRDNHLISDTLLQFCVQQIDADAGAVFLNGESTDDNDPELTASWRLNPDLIKALSVYAQNPPSARTLYYSWVHDKMVDIWETGCQVLSIHPIRTKDSRLGAIMLLFHQAPEDDLEAPALLEVLSLQAGIHIAHNRLNREMNREKLKMEGILAGITTLISTVNQDMTITWNSPHACTFLDLPQNTPIINEKCYALYRNRDKICPECPVLRVFEKGESQRIVQRWRTHDNQIRWIEAAAFPLHDELGKVTSAILVNTDVTQQINENLTVNRFSHAIDSIGEAVIILDMNGNIVYTNASFHQLFKHEKKEIENESAEMLFTTGSRDMFKHILSLTRKDKSWNGELELQDRNRNVMMVSLTASTVKDGSGFLSGVVFTCFDISEQKREKREFMKRYQELEVLTNIAQTVRDTQDTNLILRNVLNTVVESSGASAGAVVTFESDDRKPVIEIEHNVPVYLVKFTDEIRHGRKSKGFDQLTHAVKPLICSDLRTNSLSEARLLVRLGFTSMVSVRLMVSDKLFGLLVLLSRQPFQFREDDTTTYSAIASQVGLSIQNSRLHLKLLQEARVITTGEVLNQVGGDVNLVLQGLEASRYTIESALKSKDMTSLEDGWEAINLQIWHLYQILTNILDYPREFPQLFFPENPNSIAEDCIRYIQTQQYSKRLILQFTHNDTLDEVFVNKQTLSKAINNLLTLAVEAVWQKETPQISVYLKEKTDNPDRYQVIICHNGNRFPDLDFPVEPESELRIPDIKGVGLAIAIVRRLVKSHYGEFHVSPCPDNPDNQAFIMEFPRYPGVQ
jgi:PAS domain S-box-containing protein